MNRILLTVGLALILIAVVTVACAAQAFGQPVAPCDLACEAGKVLDAYKGGLGNFALIATFAAVVLKFLTQIVLAISGVTSKGKQWIPLILAGFGFLVAVLGNVAGLGLAQSIILGLSGPGALLLNEIMKLLKPKASNVIPLVAAGKGKK